jgi:hypothetical protein
MKSAALLIIALALTAAACSDDDAGATTPTTNAATSDSTQVDYSATLTAEEIEWCTFTDSSVESADRFDVIFEAGLTLGLEMDSLNALAQANLDERMAQGMARDEAAAAVSQDLFTFEAFTLACHEAFTTANGG